MQVEFESKVELPMDQRRIRANLAHEDSFVAFPAESIERPISERFEQIVRLCPDKLALKTQSEGLTYDQLNQAANRVAHALLEHCENHQEPVALLFENGAAFIMASLGALKAGQDPGPA